MKSQLSIINNQSLGDELWSAAERDAWRLAPAGRVSQWADQNRVLSAYSADGLGPWRTARTPYLAGPMDAYSDPDVEEIDILGPSQSGKTEAVFNMIGYTVDQDPAPCLYVIARDEDCDYISEDRLWPMCNDSPALARHLTGRPWDYKKGSQITFDRMPLYFAGSQSAAGLASKPIGRLFLDELDGYKEVLGKQGDPEELATGRTTTFFDFKIVRGGTITTEDGKLWQSYRRSNRQRYPVPCPYCGQFAVLKFRQLKVDPPDLRDPEIIIVREAAYYECEFCKEHIFEGQKPDMVAAGVWLPEGQRIDKDRRITGRALRSKRHSGFRWSALISPFPGVSWHRIMARWFAANSDEGIAQGKLRVFKNQILTEPWTERAKTVKHNELVKKRGDFARGTAPSDVKVLVAGADYHVTETGIERIDYEVRGFGYSLKNFLVTSGSAYSFDELAEEMFMHTWPWADPEYKAPELEVALCCIDSNYKSATVYDFCLAWPGLAVPIKGYQSQHAPIMPSALERSVTRGKRYRGALILYKLDTGFFKEQVTDWAENAAGQPRSTVYYRECPDVYFQQFTNEKKVKKRDKYNQTKFIWTPVSGHAQTHFLDTAVYAAAAAWIKRLHFLKKPTDKTGQSTTGRRVGRIQGFNR